MTHQRAPALLAPSARCPAAAGGGWAAGQRRFAPCFDRAAFDDWCALAGLALACFPAGTPLASAPESVVVVGATYDSVVRGSAEADGCGGGEHFGLRPVPHGAWVGACVVWVGVGDAVFVLVGDGLVVFFGGALVVAGGFGAVVRVATVVPCVVVGRVVGAYVTGRSLVGTSVVAAGVGRAGGVVARATSGVGVSLTLTLRLRWSLDPKVDGITESGSAWNPITASRPVATVAISTITMLGSSGPRRVFFRVTVATSPGRFGCPAPLLSAGYPTDCTGVVTFCDEQ